MNVGGEADLEGADFPLIPRYKNELFTFSQEALLVTFLFVKESIQEDSKSVLPFFFSSVFFACFLY